MAKIYCFFTKELLADIPLDIKYIQMKQMENAGLGKIEFDHDACVDVFVWNDLEGMLR